MSVDRVRQETEKNLGSGAGDLSYLTDDLLADYEAAAVALDDSDELKSNGRYGNSLAWRNGRIYWTSGDPETDHYGCGSGRRFSVSASSHVADYEGNCTNSNLTYWLIRRR